MTLKQIINTVKSVFCKEESEYKRLKDFPEYAGEETDENKGK